MQRVRATGDSTTLVEAFDPNAKMGLSETRELDDVAADARPRLEAMLEQLDRA